MAKGYIDVGGYRIKNSGGSKGAAAIRRSALSGKSSPRKAFVAGKNASGGSGGA